MRDDVQVEDRPIDHLWLWVSTTWWLVVPVWLIATAFLGSGPADADGWVVIGPFELAPPSPEEAVSSWSRFSVAGFVSGIAVGAAVLVATPIALLLMALPGRGAPKVQSVLADDVLGDATLEVVAHDRVVAPEDSADDAEEDPASSEDPESDLHVPPVPEPAAPVGVAPVEVDAASAEAPTEDADDDVDRLFR